MPEYAVSSSAGILNDRFHTSSVALEIAKARPMTLVL